MRKKLVAILFFLFIIFSSLPVSAWDGFIEPYCSEEGCTLCDGIRMAKGILDWIIKISVSVAMLSIVIGGVMYIFSGANPKLSGTARKVLTDTAIGIGLIFGSWLIVNIILVGLGVSSFAVSQGLLSPAGWFVIVCK